ncbi:Bax inhibitor-1/YccA family protein [Marinifilum fragile]|nr:Bax inhibitor-1/YccA family protein [Marinifilum fragile]
MNATYPGIVMQAVGLTFGTLFAMLFAYKTGLIKVTQKFKAGIVAATGGIMLFYLVSWIMNMFGIGNGFYYGSSLLSIGISLFVVVIAALNLVLDFDFIEKGAQSGAPKYMEWYGAFGLMVTLIWLYVELLRLLAKIANRD